MTNIKHYNQDGFESRFNYIKAILETNKGIPESKTNMVDYQAVIYFFRHYSEIKEVIKLKYIYVAPDCFPLDGKKVRKIKLSNFHLKNPFKVRQLLLSCDYVLYVYKRFGMIPAEKSYPMQLIKKAPLLEQKITNRYYADSIRNFIDEMQKLGCSNQEIVSLKSILLSTE